MSFLTPNRNLDFNEKILSSTVKSKADLNSVVSKLLHLNMLKQKLQKVYVKT